GTTRVTVCAIGSGGER
ncbi:hypothetical protein ECEC1869_2062, partial [Escherichia coli EC1869]